MKQLFKFLHDYKLFSVALLALIISLILLATHQRTAAHWLLGIVSILEALPLLGKMWQDIRYGRYGIDILAVTAVVASVVLGQYWAAIVVVLMLTGGQSLEDFAERRAQTELRSLLKHAPQTAHVLRKGKILDIKASEIHVGDKVIIKAGETVPVDGLIIEGQANFDESSLTGESLPQAKQLKDIILSGSINLDGAVTIKASALAEDSQYQQIIKLVRSAAATQAPFVRLADRYSLPFTAISYAIAITVWILSGQAIRFLEVIIVATPCPLLLAAPIALISGMSRASRYGIIVKTGKALEKLASAQTIVFDKTGTLTKGELSVDQVITLNGFSDEDVLRLGASLEQNSNHILAAAVVKNAVEKKIKLIKAKRVSEVAGQGLKAVVKGQEILVGNQALLVNSDVPIPYSFKHNMTSAYVAVDGKLAGVITFTDDIRLESKETLETIHALGVKDIAMITGDNQAVADAVGKSLAIDEVHAQALPADKLSILSHFKLRPVVFVGDGINDAPVLTAADVGIALGAKGSTAASESADMVILLDDLSRVAVGLEIAKKTFQIARQSILVGIGLSLVLMLIFATGKLKPLTGALLQEVVDIFVIFNALRAHVITPSMMNKHEGNH